jgi:oligopeptide/dipeptide ABC transporter ATP-binding protein
VSVLEVSGLTIDVKGRGEVLNAVDDVSFSVEEGEILGLVGESGSGKSLTALAIMCLLPPSARRREGRIVLGGVPLETMSERRLRRVRGSGIAMVFQDPSTSLDPAMTVGRQLSEVVRLHRRCSGQAAWGAAIEAMQRVRIPNARLRMDDYPHHLSGGTLQRVLIAMALVPGPKVLIADEPTTGLDAATRVEVIALLSSLRAELAMSVVLITHDFGVVGELSDRVAVMYAGEIVEICHAADLAGSLRHPYSVGLLRSLPAANTGAKRVPELPGEVPSLGHRPAGCRYAPRCERAEEGCRSSHPRLEEGGAEALVRCYHPVARR